MPTPEQHTGPNYGEVLSHLSRATNVRRYIEIGVSRGHVFKKISCVHGIGVDPCFDLTENVAENKAMISLFQMTSDDFFETMNPRRLLGGTADLVFLDGMHLFEFLLRDFLNAEAFCAKDSIIALHDCLPLNANMACRNIDQSRQMNRGTAFAEWWTGDVWKLIPILRRYRPDLSLLLVDAWPTGVLFVSSLDPSSRILQRRYEEIVETYRALPNDDRAIDGLYAANALVPAEEALRILGTRHFTIEQSLRPSLVSRLLR